MTRSFLLCALLALPLAAQLSFIPAGSFTNAVFAGNGTIGVCMDSNSGDIWVVDFSNDVNLHQFTTAGTLINSYPTNTCNPSLTSPNDITQDRNTGTLWLVDNDTPGEVLNYSLAGACGTGFGLGNAYVNPVGMTHHPVRNSLFISHAGQVNEWSTTGQNLNFSFVPTVASPSTIIAGITYYPPTGNFLIVLGTSTIYEVDITGVVLGQFVVPTPGVSGLQGIDFEPVSGRLVVCDNPTVTIHVFQGPVGGTGYQINTASASLDFNGTMGSFSSPALFATPMNTPFTLNASSLAIGVPFDFLISQAQLLTPTTGAVVTSDGQIINVNLNDPTLAYFWNFFQSPPFANFSAPVQVGIPGGYSIQMVVLDPFSQIGFSVSQPTRLTVY